MAKITKSNRYARSGRRRKMQKDTIEVKKDIYLTHLSKFGIPAEAARVAGWTMTTIYKHMESDEDFALKCDEAQGLATGKLELEARRRAVEGTEDLVVHSGEVVYMRDPETGELLKDELGDPIPVVKRIYSDRLLETLLKANNPEKFRENVKVDHAVSGGVLLVGMSGQPTEEGKAKGLTLLEELEEQQAQYRNPKIIEHEPAKK